MRERTVSEWIATSSWSDWARQPLAGDASTRRYERLVSPDGARSVILMDAPPDRCGSLDAFLHIAKHLRSGGLAAPSILAESVTHGLLILEDLGKVDFAQHLLANPSDEILLYRHAVDTIVQIQTLPLPDDLLRLTPEVGAKMLDPFFEWFAPDASSEGAQRIRSELSLAMHAISADVASLSLRDFHAENLIWRPDQQGLNRVGLLDFQDAFAAHPAYDLVSLLRDARRDVSDKTTRLMLDYFATMTGTKLELLARAFAVLSVQRNLRILGIFRRLAQRDGKQGYLSLIPRVRSHILKDIEHPSLARLRPLLLHMLHHNETPT